MKTLSTAILASWTIGLPLYGAVTLGYGNNSSGDTFLRDIGGVPLTSGPKGPGDGAVIEVGYYSMATTADPFAGDWVALIGPGTGVEAVTIGDANGGAGGDGIFGGTVILGASHPGSVAYPTGDTPVAIRFYDGTSIGGSTYYNSATMSNWTWRSDGTLGLDIFPTPSTAMIWEGGLESAYRTTIAVVPEASSSMFVMLGSAALLVRRRRKKIWKRFSRRSRQKKKGMSEHRGLLGQLITGDRLPVRREV